jgi:ferredoxin
VGSGVSRLRSARLKPSVARFLRFIPEPFFRLTPLLLRLRPRIQNQLCVRCGLCAGICPKHAINQDARTDYPVINAADCIDCFCCVESCPESAIATQLYLGNLVCLGQQTRRKAPAK